MTIEKSEQKWRDRLATEVKSGNQVAFAGGKQLTAEEVLTSDATMMDMIYITREEMQDADNNPQNALERRMVENLSRMNDVIDTLIITRMSERVTIPIYKRALGDLWKDRGNSSK